MATYIKGDAIANATSYELFKKMTGTSGATSYTSLATATEINFKADLLGLPEGDHTLVVKAKANGYIDSEYSNEVTYAVGLIYSFSINANGRYISCECPEGMTWADWCDSKYSPAGFSYDDSKVYYLASGAYVRNVSPTGTIVNAADYSVVSGSASGDAATITFTVNGTSFSALEGMCWYDWCANNTYNVDGYRCSGGDLPVYASDSADYIADDSNGKAVVGATQITSGGAYVLNKATAITFTIDGKIYEADSDMTSWYWWTRSTNCSGEFTNSGDYSYVHKASTGKKVKDSDGIDVLGQNWIDSNGVYVTTTE